MTRKQLLLIGVFALAALVAMTQTIAEHIAMTDASTVQPEGPPSRPVAPRATERRATEPPRRATCLPAGPGPARGPSCEPRGGPARTRSALLGQP